MVESQLFSGTALSNRGHLSRTLNLLISRLQITINLQGLSLFLLAILGLFANLTLDIFYNLIVV